jgi:hypothetical protein
MKGRLLGKQIYSPVVLPYAESNPADSVDRLLVCAQLV